jgi:hypothetical protein
MAERAIVPRDPAADVRTKRAFNRIAGQNQNPNVFFAGPPSGAALAPTFRQIVTADLMGSAIPLTTKGDLLGFSTTGARVPVGINNLVLTADSTQAVGLSYKAGVLTLDSQFTFIANVGVGVNNMMSVTIPGGLLSVNGDYIEMLAEFTFNGAGGAEAVNLNWGSQVLVLTVPNGTAGAMSFRVMIQRITQTTQNCLIDFAGTVGAIGTVGITGTQDLSVNNNLAFTAQAAGGSNKIFQNAMITKFSHV